MLGVYLFVIGVLTFMHWEFVALNSNNSSAIFKETIDQLIKGLNSMMATGILGDNISVGGGIIGGVFSLIFFKLSIISCLVNISPLYGIIKYDSSSQYCNGFTS